MNWWQGAVLGVVQGLTEFLPISSSGHLVVAQAAVGLSIPGVLVEVTLHVATLLAVLIVYWTRLGELVAGAIRGDRTAWGYVGLLVLGTIPAGAIGLLFADWFERAFDSLLMVGVSFLVTAGILWSTRRIQIVMVKQTPSWTGAFSIGLAQALAVMPGISRSGSTIAAGLWLGLDPVRAAEYSFLLAVPAILGAAILQLPHLSGDLGSVGIGPLAVGFVCALVSGVLAIRALVGLLRKGGFHRFAPYCFLLGIVVIVWGTVVA